MGTVVSALAAGILLSPAYGIGCWLAWQSMKVGTILPRGQTAETRGGTLSLVIRGLCLAAMPFLFAAFGWWVAASLAIMWYVGGWVGTLVERKLYANDWTMGLVLHAGEYYAEDLGPQAAPLMSTLVPQWWVKLMPPGWQSQMTSRLAAVLLAGQESEEGTPPISRVDPQ